MTANDFRIIMEGGFKAKYKNGESEVRCFECGEVSSIGGNKMVCVNNHKIKLIDFIVRHIDMRDGVAKALLRGDCEYKKVREN
mgnify:CR=1 FL=1